MNKNQGSNHSNQANQQSRKPEPASDKKNTTQTDKQNVGRTSPNTSRKQIESDDE